MPRIRTAGLALAAVVAVLVSACTGPSDGMAGGGGGPEPSAGRVIGEAASTTRAAKLRSDLSYLLEEHVQLVALATRTTLRGPGGASSPAARAVLATLDVNSVAVSEVIGQPYPTLESPVLAAWRQHVGFFLDYAKAKAERSERGVAQARSDLDGFRTAFGLLINSVIVGLPSAAVADELKPHVDALLKTIDAQVAGEPRQFELLRSAAGHMQSTAALLAGGMASDLKLSKTETPAADLRAGLTALMTRHVYALWMAIDADQAQRGAVTDPLAASALDAVDDTSVALSEAVGSVYPDAKQPFLVSWRRHVGYPLEYASALASGGAADAARVRKDLRAYPRDFGQLVNAIVTDLPAATVTSQLEPVVTDLLAAIDAHVAGRPDAITRLRVAASRMPETAATIAAGIAQHKKLS